MNPLGSVDLAREVDEELAYHIDRRVERLVADGMSREEAHSVAEARFGGQDVVRAKCRRERARGRRRRVLLNVLGDVLQGTRGAVRSLVRTPLITITAILILGVGIGATTGVFSVVQRIIFNPLPGASTSGLYFVETRLENGGVLPVAPPSYQAWREGGRGAPSLVAFGLHEYTIFTEGPSIETLGAAVSSDFFDMLGVDVFGAGFTPDDDGPSDSRKIVLSHRLWTSVFGADSAVVGRTLPVEHGRLGPFQAEVVGIAPPGFRYPYDADFWVPLYQHIEFQLRSNKAYVLGVIARPRTTGGVNALLTELDALSPDKEIAFAVTPLNTYVSGDARRPMGLLMAAVAFVLMIACANVGNLLLTRGLRRQRELAVRRALGAGRLRIAMGFFAEGGTIAALGGGLGIAFAGASVWTVATAGGATVDGLDTVDVNGTALAFTAGLTLLTAFLASILPAARFFGEASHPELRSAAGNARRGAIRPTLLGAQLALTMMLMSGSILMIRSVHNVLAVDPGFEATRRVAFPVGEFLRSRYGGPDQQRALVAEVLRRLEEAPEVADAEFTRSLPMDGSGGISAPVRWEDESIGSSRRGANKETVSEGYFELMDIALLRGRTFNAGDRESTPAVALVNEALVRQQLPEGTDPIGMHVRTGFDRTFKEIVGVVKNVKRRDLTEGARATVYTLFRQDPWPEGTFVVRAAGPIDAVVQHGLKTLRTVAPDQPVGEILTLDEYVARSVARPRLISVILMIFAGVALVLSMGGCYAVVAAHASERRREIGIRMALGARAGDVSTHFVRETVRVTGAGAAFGVFGLFVAGRFTEGFVYGLSPTDAVSVGVSLLTLGAVALLATWIPAVRAATIHPAEVLQSEG